MATYNGEQFIAEQLESIARQSRLPDELVVSDDGSSDSTVEIVRQFASRAPFDVVVLRNQEHIANPEPWFRGYTDNFFRAMRACTGDLIALCDQDDVWHADKLMKSARPLQLDQDVSLVIHSSRVVDEEPTPDMGGPVQPRPPTTPSACRIGSPFSRGTRGFRNDVPIHFRQSGCPR